MDDGSTIRLMTAMAFQNGIEAINCKHAKMEVGFQPWQSQIRIRALLAQAAFSENINSQKKC